jgi:hypothetical protein
MALNVTPLKAVFTGSACANCFKLDQACSNLLKCGGCKHAWWVEGCTGTQSRLAPAEQRERMQLLGSLSHSRVANGAESIMFDHEPVPQVLQQGVPEGAVA